MRDANTRVWEASTTFHVQPRIMEKGTDINYKDVEGLWQKTDTALVASRAPGMALEAVRQRSKLHFSAIGEESFNVSYMIDGQAIRTGVRALALLNPLTGQRHVIGVAQASTPVAEGNKAVYRNVFPGADVEYVNNNVTFEQNLILREDFTLPNPATFGINPASAMLVVVTEIDVSGTDHAMVAKTREGEMDMRLASLADASELQFRDANGKTVHRFAHGKAWSGPRPRGAARLAGTPVWKRFQWTAGKLFLLEGLRHTTLADMPRPITIDYDWERTGTQTKNEVWDQDKTWWVSAPYYLNGAHLVIDPGTVVKLGNKENGDDDEAIYVWDGATITAVGEPYLPIFFTAFSDDGYGADIDGTGGNDVQPTRGDGNYGYAIFFQESEHNASQVQYCRFRWAWYGIVNSRSTLVDDQEDPIPIRDCIFNNCDGAVAILNWGEGGPPGQEPDEGVEPEITLTNNLIYDCNSGVRLLFLDCGASSQNIDLNLNNNTIANCDDAVLVDSEYQVIVNITGCNNVFANCVHAFADPDTMVNDPASYGSMDFDGYADISGDYATGYWGSIMGSVFGENDVDSTFEDAMDTDHTENGAYYLRQSGQGTLFVNVGTGSLGELGEKTTTAPEQKDCNTNGYSADEWGRRADDTGTVDLGYHHPPVDYVVGVPDGQNVSTTKYTGTLTIPVAGQNQRGIVVAMYRPDWGSDDTPTNPYFPYLQCEAQLVCNNIGGGATTRYTREKMVRFDSSYYVGTKFFDNRRTDSDGDYSPAVPYGPDTEAGGIILKGNYSQCKATLFRHLHRALYFDGCKMRYGNETWPGPNANWSHLVGLTFERGDIGIQAKDLPFEDIEENVGDDPSNLHTMFDAFLYMSDAAFRINKTASTGYGYIVTVHNHTFLNCKTVMYMNCGQAANSPYYTSLWSGVNCVVGCEEGYTGNHGNKNYQWDWVVEAFIADSPDTDAYWNNGFDIDHDGVKTIDDQGQPDENLDPRHVNPLLVSLPSADEAKEWHSMYLAQEEHDASLIPFRLDKVDADDPFDNLQSWPSGQYTVVVYGVDSVAGWSQGSNLKATQDIISGAWDTQGGPTVYNNAPGGDLLVEIWRLDNNGGSGSNACAFDLRLENDSLLTIWFDKSVIAGMTQGERVLVWVGLDGSTFYATEAHDAVSSAVLKHNARYAMWYVSGSRMMSAYDGRPGDAEDKRSPAIDIMTTSQPKYITTNGTTSTEAPTYQLDNNEDGNGNFLIDGGFHYWGWNFKYQQVTVQYGAGESGQKITNGDTDPTEQKGTDFGPVTQYGDPVSRTFTVRNDGGAALTLGTVNVSGKFRITEGLSSPLGPNQVDTFTVEFYDTSEEGLWQEDVYFTTNDAYANPFEFRVQAYVGI